MSLRYTLRAIIVDLFRAVVSIKFILSVVCGVAVLLLIAQQHIWDEGASVTYIISWCTIESLYMSFFILPSLPYSGSYVMDYNSKFLVQSKIRVGRKAYAVSKAVATAVAGALSMLLSYLIIISILAVVLPIQSAYIIDAEGYEQWILNGQPFMFLASKTMLAMFMGALVAEFSLWASAHIQNQLVIVISPVIAFYTQDIICYLMGIGNISYVSLSAIIFYTPGFTSLALCLGHSCGVILLLTVLFAVLFVKKISVEV